MKTDFSLRFFRKYFRIPLEVELCWCVLTEKDNETMEEQQRLGVMLCGTTKVIDVAARRFVQTGLPLPVSYEAFPAVCCHLDDEMVFNTRTGTQLRLPDSYVADIYFRSVYSEEMMNQPLI